MQPEEPTPTSPATGPVASEYNDPSPAPLPSTEAAPAGAAAFAPRTDFSHLTARTAAVRQQIGQVIVGQQEVQELLLTALLADGHVLLEGVPKGTDVAKVRAGLTAHAAVLDVHDLHVWALASSTPALTAHVVMRDGTDADALRRELGARLHEEFGIDHVTLQIETDHCGEACGQPVKHAHDHDHDHDAQGHHCHVHR